MTTRNDIIRLYRHRARNYDFTANLYYLIGFREWAYRRRATAALDLKPGDTVVEIGCGTGLNFKLLQQAVGPQGRIIGVDLTDAMLDQARERVQDEGWDNVELVHQDALKYRFPAGVNGILSTFAISLIPECGQIIEHGAQALAADGTLVIADLKVPDNLPGWLQTLMFPLVRPFVPSSEFIERRPWDTIRMAMTTAFGPVDWQDVYGGFSYIAAGRNARARE